MRFLIFTCLPLMAQNAMFFGGNYSLAPTAPTLVSQCVAPASTGSSGTVACSSTLSLAAGNTLAVWVRTQTTTTTVTSVCDGTGTGGCTGSDTFTSITGCTAATVGAGQWWYAKNIAANAAATITVTLSVSDGFRGVWAGQFAHLSTSAPLDAGPACNSATSTTPTTASFTTTHNNEVLLIATNVAALSVTYTAGSGYTLGTASVDGDLQVEYKVVSATQTGVTGGFTIANNTWSASAMTLTQ